MHPLQVVSSWHQFVLITLIFLCIILGANRSNHPPPNTRLSLNKYWKCRKYRSFYWSNMYHVPTKISEHNIIRLKSHLVFLCKSNKSDCELDLKKNIFVHFGLSKWTFSWQPPNYLWQIIRSTVHFSIERIHFSTFKSTFSLEKFSYYCVTWDQISFTCHQYQLLLATIPTIFCKLSLWGVEFYSPLRNSYNNTVYGRRTYNILIITI